MFDIGTKSVGFDNQMELTQNRPTTITNQIIKDLEILKPSNDVGSTNYENNERPNKKSTSNVILNVKVEIQDTKDIDDSKESDETTSNETSMSYVEPTLHGSQEKPGVKPLDQSECRNSFGSLSDISTSDTDSTIYRQSIAVYNNALSTFIEKAFNTTPSQSNAISGTKSNKSLNNDTIQTNRSKTKLEALEETQTIIKNNIQPPENNSSDEKLGKELYKQSKSKKKTTKKIESDGKSKQGHKTKQKSIRKKVKMGLEDSKETSAAHKEIGGVLTGEKCEFSDRTKGIVK